MEPRKRRIAVWLDGMQMLLTLLLLWACEALRGWGACLLPVCLLPLAALTADRRWIAYPLAVVLAAALILFLPLPHYAWFGFVFVLSWYAPVRRLLTQKLDVVKGGLAAFGLCNLGAALGLGVLLLLGARPLAGLSPLLLIVIGFGSEITFLLCDVAYQLFTKLWMRVFKKALSV